MEKDLQGTQQAHGRVDQYLFLERYMLDGHLIIYRGSIPQRPPIHMTLKEQLKELTDLLDAGSETPVTADELRAIAAKAKVLMQQLPLEAEIDADIFDIFDSPKKRGSVLSAFCASVNSYLLALADLLPAPPEDILGA